MSEILRPRASDGQLLVSSSAGDAGPSSLSPARDTSALRKSPSHSTLAVSTSTTTSPSQQRARTPGLSPSESWSSFQTLPRARSPTPYSPEVDPARDELRAVLQALQRCEPKDLSSKLHLGAQLHRLLIESSHRGHAKDDFRDAGGFVTVIQLLSSLESTYVKPSADGDAAATPEQDLEMHERLRIEVFKTILSVLSEAITSHAINLATFESSIGWSNLESTLALSTISLSSPAHFFGGILGLAMGDVSSHFSRLAALLTELKQKEGAEDEKEGRAFIEARAKEPWNSAPLQHARAVGIALSLARGADAKEEVLHWAVIYAAKGLAASRQGQVAMAAAGVASCILSDLQSKPKVDDEKWLAELLIVQRVFELGLPVPDGRSIFRSLAASPSPQGPLLDLLLSIVGPTQEPNTVTFDMSRYGHASMALSSLRRPFPPGPSSKGFSFFAMMRIERIEPSLPVDILHIFDAQRTCSVKLSLEPGSGEVTYSTSIGAPPIRFSRAELRPKRWYHICLTHARPKGGAATSTAQLFIDGRLVGQQAAPWPALAPAVNSPPIRVVFGNPPNVVPSVPQTPATAGDTPTAASRPRNRLVWSLGPAYLIDSLIGPDLPLVLYELGPRYAGNLQDSLGRFLTYSNSTQVNLALDAMTRASGLTDRDLQRQPLVAAITGAASELFAEERIYFVLNAVNTWRLDRAAPSIDASQRPGPVMVLNQAVPLTKDAIAASYGYAKLYGSPVLAAPEGLDETIWKLGGCAVLLALVERAGTPASLDGTLRLFFAVVAGSWRMSEDVEKAQGYEVLVHLLHQKLSLVSLTTLDIFLAAVGVSKGRADESALTNPFLFRIALLDFELWTKAPASVQIAHLESLGHLLRTSKHRRFNIKRVARMQIVRKLLHALRGRLFADEAVPHAITAVRKVLAASFNDAALRSVTAYLASQLYTTPGEEREQEPTTATKPSAPPRPTPKRQLTFHPGAAPASDAIEPSTPPLTSSSAREVPLQIFDALAQLVLERPAYLAKFANAVNIKWLLLFLHPRTDRRAAASAFDILGALVLRDARYHKRFLAAGGFKVCERLLPRFWSGPTVLPQALTMLFGAEPLEGKPLRESFRPERARSLRTPPILRAVLACLGEGLSACDRRENEGGRRRPTQGRVSDFLEMDLATAVRRGGAGGTTHTRTRSRSMNADAKELAEAFQSSKETALLDDVVHVIEAQARSSLEFRDALFLPSTLRCLIEVLLPSAASGGVEALASAAKSPSGDLLTPDARPKTTLRIRHRLLDLIGSLVCDSVVNSASTAVLATLYDSMPAVDLATRAGLRAALYAKVCKAVEEAVRQSPPLVADAAVLDALAAFVGGCLDDTSNLSHLPALTTLIAAILDATQGQRDIATLAHSSLAPGLHRLVSTLARAALFRVAGDAEDVMQTMELLTTHQRGILRARPPRDDTTVQCLAHQALAFGSSETADAATKRTAGAMIKLLALWHPAALEAALLPAYSMADLHSADADSAATVFVSSDAAEGEAPTKLPFDDVWQGFVKSKDVLRTASHLERVENLKSILEKSDARDRSAASIENRMLSWHDSIQKNEDHRFHKAQSDSRELTLFSAGEWAKMLGQLKGEGGLLGPAIDPDRRWQLDPTEGPLRMRSRLQEYETSDSNRIRELRSKERPQSSSHTLQPSSDAEPNESGIADEAEDMGDDSHAERVASGEHGEAAVDVPPTPQSATPSALPNEETAESADSAHDDKFRRVLRALERGDVVEAVFNTSRVVGIECRAALLLLGRKSIYLVDDYFQRPNGELVNVWEAPEQERDALVVAVISSDASQPSSLIAELEGEAQTRKWPWQGMKAAFRRAFLHRRTAVEIFFEDGQNFLLVLNKTVTADLLMREIGVRNKSAVAVADAEREGIRQIASTGGGQASSLSARLAGAVLGRLQNHGSLTQAWVNRQISNFDYLMRLNSIAGRTHADFSQYPVFPWIIADWESEQLDLSKPETFRDLELPMGAQTQQRRAEFIERYEQLREMDDGSGEARPFHYGTHYSTAATVCGFLIRLRPFERLLRALQGGSYDLADRTFSSLGKAWRSASELSRGDVRELTPEFFYMPEFLSNSNRFDFGRTQAGLAIDDVELPPWARGSASVFIQKHREALESDYVSARLHLWIDLIFGCKQRGEAAVQATNIFHPLSYDDGVDLEAIESSMERQAAAQVIFNFGQTPTKLFDQPHPQRKPRSDDGSMPFNGRLGLSDTPWLLIQGIAPIRSLRSGAVHFIHAERPERAFASPRDYMILPALGLSMSSANLDGSLRVFSSRDSSRPVTVVEQASSQRTTCMAAASNNLVLCGNSDGVLTAWKVTPSSKELAFAYALRGHTGSVLCVAASPAWSIAVSGGEDGLAIVWDLNRARYIRALRDHDDVPVQTVAIDECSGMIATACGPGVRLWTINGDLIAAVSTNASLREPVSSLAFFEQEHHEGRLAMLLTGHRGKVILWSCSLRRTQGRPEAAHQRTASTLSLPSTRESPSTTSSPWYLEPYHVFEHSDRLGPSTTPLITALRATTSMLFTGDELGRLYAWSLPGEAVSVPDNFSGACMGPCGKRFGVLEAKRSCAGCGGLFCNADAPPFQAFGGQRFCASCRDTLALLPRPVA